jgi:nitrite reductase/ring-hydroxylating ferredoxin subunit
MTLPDDAKPDEAQPEGAHRDAQPTDARAGASTAASPPADAPPAGHSAEQFLCASDALIEKGDAFVFDVSHFRYPATAFALRFEGKVVCYLNRCVHVPTELDWTPGKFLDSEREFIICSIHGAAYHPATGRCAGGPCGRGSLTMLKAEEHDGAVWWHPTRDTQPRDQAPA